MLRKLKPQGSLKLILVPARCGCPHGAHVTLGRNVRRMAHDFNFTAVFNQPLLVKQPVDINQITRRVPRTRRAVPQANQHTQDRLIEIRALSYRVINVLATFYQPRQNIVYVVDRKGVIKPILAHGAIGTDHRTFPQRGLWIRLLTK